MNRDKVLIISTAMLALSTFLGVLGALIYYAHQILKINKLEIATMTNIYIFINLIFLYYLIRKTKW